MRRVSFRGAFCAVAGEREEGVSAVFSSKGKIPAHPERTAESRNAAAKFRKNPNARKQLFSCGVCLLKCLLSKGKRRIAALVVPTGIIPHEYGRIRSWTCQSGLPDGKQAHRIGNLSPDWSSNQRRSSCGDPIWTDPEDFPRSIRAASSSSTDSGPLKAASEYQKTAV